MFSLCELHSVLRTSAAAVDHVVERVSASTPGYLVTVNLDHYRRLQSDADFRDLYGSSDAQTVDGAPIRWLFRLFGVDLERVTGVDLTSSVLRAGFPIRPLLAGGAPGVAARAAQTLRRSGVAAEAMDPGEVANAVETGNLIAAKAAELGCNLILVCLGSPKQEQVARTIAVNGGPYSLCVGAFVDFAAGDVRRAPPWAQKAGAEWLFRLAAEPGRLWRRYAQCLVVLPVMGWREWRRSRNWQEPPP